MVLKRGINVWTTHFNFFFCYSCDSELSYSYWLVIDVNERSTPGSIELSKNIM
jgi:hypothetical protein